MCARPVTPWSMGFHDYWNGEASRSADDSSHKRARNIGSQEELACAPRGRCQDHSGARGARSCGPEARLSCLAPWGGARLRTDTPDHFRAGAQGDPWLSDASPGGIRAGGRLS